MTSEKIFPVASVVSKEKSQGSYPGLSLVRLGKAQGGKLAQLSSVLALVDDLGFIPSTHTVVHNHS